MKKHTLIATLLTASIALNGCTVTVINEDENIQEEKEVFAVDETQNEVEKTPDTVETAEGEIEGPSEENVLPVNDFHNYTVETEEAETTAPDGTLLATYSCSYPVFEANMGDDAEYIEAINEMFKDNALMMVNVTENEYESLVEEYENSKNYEYQFRPYDYSYDFEIHTDAKGIISITETQYAYLGGAHGMAGKSSYTFDVVNGNELSLSDLLYGTEDEIVEAFAKEFVKVSDMFYPGDDPAEVVTEEFPYAEYYVDADGVTAYFQEYHVGPYSSGFVSATISDKEMLKFDFSDTTEQ